jgi:hypothetical protein
MEGISGEAASLAGHLRFSNLCWIYDSNRITIEGSTALAFSEDVATRFIAYGWGVTGVGDASDLDMLSRAFETFRKETGARDLRGRAQLVPGGAGRRAFPLGDRRPHTDEPAGELADRGPERTSHEHVGPVVNSEVDPRQRDERRQRQ